MSLSIFTELEITQDLKISNDLEISGNIVINGNILMSDVESTLNLKTIKSNRSTNIDPCGNYVDISGSALLVPRGPYESRMSIDGTLDIGATAKAGMIMYDTSQNQFIGVIDTAKPNSDGPELVWTGLGGVISTDQKTRIEATNDGANSGLKFFTNTLDDHYNMCINENGNVGIGNAMFSANEFLYKASHLNLFTNTNASFLISHAAIGELGEQDFGGGLKLTFETGGNAKIYNTYSTGDLIFGSGGYNDRMRILANGNVGIGADSPKTKLQIGDIANFQEGYMHTTSSGEGSWDTNSMLIIHPEPTSNTNDPKPVLYLSRKGSAVGSTLECFGALATFSISRYEDSGTNSRTRLDIKLDDDVPGLTQPTDVMTLLANGNVGIGTTSPHSKLNIGNHEVSSITYNVIHKLRSAGSLKPLMLHYFMYLKFMS